MKTFNRQAAQGDVLFIRVNELPQGAVPVDPENGQVIVAHSETGHNHVMTAKRTTLYRLPDEIYEAFLVVSETDELVHNRAHDTHETIQFQPGVYRVRRQREYTPEGFRRVED